MNRKIIICLSSFLFLVIGVVGAQNIFTGEGSEASPYRINSGADLIKLRDLVNSGNAFEKKYFLLTTDINLDTVVGIDSISGWVPIGDDSYPDYYVFGGNFDGGNHKIINIKANNLTKDVALFGSIANENTDTIAFRNIIIENPVLIANNVASIALSVRTNTLLLEDCQVNNAKLSGNNVSGLVGKIICRESSGYVKNSSFSGEISAENLAAGLIGRVGGESSKSVTLISDCRASVNIVKSSIAGGLVADLNRASIENCSISGSINSTFQSGGLASSVTFYDSLAFIRDCNVKLDINTTAGICGGIVGNFGSEDVFQIRDCSYEGILNGSLNTGGIIGLVHENKLVSIQNCFSIGTINTTGNFTGGIIGNVYGDIHSIKNCNSYMNIYSNGKSCGGLIGGIGSRIDSIKSSSFSGQIRSDDNDVGGLIGSVTQNCGVVIDCFSNCNVYGNSNVAGLIGLNEGFSSLGRCYSLGNVFATGDNVGGLTGNSNRDILNCFSEVRVNGKNNVGGLSAECSNIINSYASGSVYSNLLSGFPTISGLANNSTVKNSVNVADTLETLLDDGYRQRISNGSVYNCFSNKDYLIDGAKILQSNPEYGENSYHGAHASQTELKLQSFYESLGWDFDSIWYMSPCKNYPQLKAFKSKRPDVELSTTAASCSKRGNGNAVVKISAQLIIKPIMVLLKDSTKSVILHSDTLYSQSSTLIYKELSPASYNLMVYYFENACDKDTIIPFTINDSTIKIKELYFTPLLDCAYSHNGEISVLCLGGSGKYDSFFNNEKISNVVNGQKLDFPNLKSGNYDFFMVNSDSVCLDTVRLQKTILLPSPINIDLSSANVQCHGIPTGHISVLAKGGTGAIIYQWHKLEDSAYTFAQETKPLPKFWLNQDGSSFETGVTGVEKLVEGKYYVTAIDAKGCSYNSDTIQITQPTLLQLNYSYTDAGCFGGTNGVVSFDATGGTFPYTYILNGAKVIGSVSSGLSAGNYSFGVIDSLGCQLVTNMQINQLPEIDLSLVLIPVCSGANSGRIVAEASGGTEPYQYSLDNEVSYNNENCKTATLGVHTFYVRDSNNCTNSKTIQMGSSESGNAANIPNPNFLASSWRFSSDTILLIDVSRPAADSIVWSFDTEDIEQIKPKDLGLIGEENPNVLGIVLKSGYTQNGAGEYVFLHPIRMTAYYGNCDYLVEQSEVKVAPPGSVFYDYTPQSGRGIKSMRVTPNPVQKNGTAIINVELYQPSEITINLISVTGSILSSEKYLIGDSLSFTKEISASNNVFVQIKTKFDFKTQFLLVK